MSQILKAHGMSEKDEISDRLHIAQEPDDGPFFSLKDTSIYKCPSCKDDLEQKAYTALSSALSPINSEVQKFLTLYIKGYVQEPSSIEVYLHLDCQCSKHRVAFYKPFEETKALTQQASEFWLAGPDDTGLLTDIDGIYTRDQCVEMFKKLLVRWRARNRVVLLVVPFIGLDYKGREKNRVDLWDLILRYSDPSRTLLVTRRSTYSGFLKAAARIGLNLELLKKFGIEAPLLKQLGSKKAFFKQQSHAKFYAAVGPETTEVLSGSFNIHSGGYAENLMFRNYLTADFVRRYLLPLEVFFDLNQTKSTGRVLSIEIIDDKALPYKVRDAS